MFLSDKNILNHILMPKFEVLSSKEAKLFLKEKGITKEGLPIIKFSDPVIPLINAKEGDIIKITRKSAFSGDYFYYRVVE